MTRAIVLGLLEYDTVLFSCLHVCVRATFPCPWDVTSTPALARNEMLYAYRRTVQNDAVTVRAEVSASPPIVYAIFLVPYPNSTTL